MAPTKLCVADFNGDDFPDLGYGNYNAPNPPTVGILWGTGTGSFPAFSPVYVGPPSGGGGWIEAADIDGDLDVDAVVDVGGLPTAILRNNGNGTFVTEPLAAVGNFLVNRGHTFAEMNGDDRPDLVFRDVDPVHGSSLPELVCVQLNNGLGQFRSTGLYPVTTQPGKMFSGSDPLAVDLDGDGRDEVAIRRDHDCSATFEDMSQLLVFHNAGNGALELPTVYQTDFGSIDNWLAKADLNDDARQDLVVTSRSSSTVLLNVGDGGFLTPHGTQMGQAQPSGLCGYGTFTEIKHITSGDINNDGRFDLVGVREGVHDPHSFLECTVMLQDAQGAFTTLSSVPLVQRATQDLELADFNRDGNLDMAVSTRAQLTNDAVRIAMGNGDGTFDPWVTYPIFAPLQIRAGDLNGDLWPDLVVSNDKIAVRLNNGNGTFGPVTQYAGGSIAWFDIADLNGDGALDVAFKNHDGATGVRYLRVLLNNGNGTFVLSPQATNLDDGWPDGVVCADVNADGFEDVLLQLKYSMITQSPGGVGVALNNGDATFSSISIVNPGADYRFPTVADLDADGHADLVTTAPVATISKHRGIVVNLGHGDGTFGQATSYAGAGLNGLNQHLILTDFDNDGRLDIGVPMGCSPDSDSDAYLGFSRLLNQMCLAPEPCPADIAPPGGNGTVNIADLLFVISNWGGGAGNPADVNGDNIVNIADLLAVISNWGPCK